MLKLNFSGDFANNSVSFGCLSGIPSPQLLAGHGVTLVGGVFFFFGVGGGCFLAGVGT